MTLTPSDKRAINAFIDRKPAKGTRIHSEYAGGVLRLTGPFLANVAVWTDSGITLNDMGSKSGETIHNFIKKHTPKNHLANPCGCSGPARSRGSRSTRKNGEGSSLSWVKASSIVAGKRKLKAEAPDGTRFLLDKEATGWVPYIMGDDGFWKTISPRGAYPLAEAKRMAETRGRSTRKNGSGAKFKVTVYGPSGSPIQSMPFGNDLAAREWGRLTASQYGRGYTFKVTSSRSRKNGGGWNGKVVRYPKGVFVEPSGFHQGPEPMQIDRAGYYVWEDMGDRAPQGFGRWSLLGPFKSQDKAQAVAARL